MRTLALLIIAACLTSGAAPATRPVATAPTAVGPEIVRIVSRRQVVVVRSGPNGPTFTVESKSGPTVLPGMTMDQLAKANPRAAESVKTMQADAMWAGCEIGGE